LIWPEPRFTDFLGSAAAPANWSTSAGAFLVHMWGLAVVGLMVSFVISFYFSANTIIYALMRNRVDKTALDEVYTYAGEMATGPAPVQPAPVEGPEQPQPADEDEATEKPEASE
jgi:hypothetical protein